MLSLVAYTGESECISVPLWRQYQAWLTGRTALMRTTGMEDKHLLRAFAILDIKNRPSVGIWPLRVMKKLD